MATPIRPSTSASSSGRVFDRELYDLVDAIVAAVDINRTDEITQLAYALEPFGGTALFRAELRLNGTVSVNDWCVCGGEAL